MDRGVSLLLTVALGVAVGYMMTRLLSYFPTGSQITPTILLAAISTPVLYLWQCVLKLNELKKLTGISQSEFRRLLPKIQASSFYYKIKMGVIIICNLCIALTFFLVPSSVVIFTLPIINYALAFIGFMIVFSTATLIECYSELGKIHDFEVKISKRESDRKRVNETLTKLTPEKSK